MSASPPSPLAIEPKVAVGWVPLAPISELRAAMPIPVPVTLAGRPWALVELDGEVSALHDVCPHRRVPLSAGKVAPGPGGRQVLECGYHGWSYRRDGACARIPALGEDVVPRGMGSVAVLSTVVAGGLVWGCPDEVPGTAPELGATDVFLREQIIDAAAPEITAALGASEGAVGGVRTGSDAFGPLRFAVRPIAPRRCALFPLVTADELAAGMAEWVRRTGALPVTPIPSDPDHER
jgi:nitrite reductase/ring-hydroxylating ferredoxin subunit